MPLRDLFIVGVLLSTLPFAFRHAFIGVLLWTWVSIMNPHKLAFGFTHNAPIAAVIAIITLIALFTTRDQVKLPFRAPIVYAALFLLWTCVTTVFAFEVAGSLQDLNRFVKILLMVLVTAAVLYKREHIRLFIWVNVLSLGFYGLKGGIYTLLTGGGGRVWGPPGGFIEGNNELALALVMIIPMMNFLRLTTPYRLVRLGLLFLMLMSVVSVAGSQSRGAFVGIAAMAVVMWWRGPNKIRNAVAVAMVGLSVLAFMPQTWHDRMGTIQTYEQDGSAMGRIHAWQTAINVANDRWSGAGYEMYSDFVFQIYYPRDATSAFDPSIARAAHSIYFQVLGEHGYIGLILFLLIWLTAWRASTRLQWSRPNQPAEGWLYHFGGMAQVSFVGYAVGGAFLSLAYFDLPYNIMLAVVVAERWRNVLRKASDAAPAPVEAGQPTRPKGLTAKVIYWIRTA